MKSVKLTNMFRDGIAASVMTEYERVQLAELGFQNKQALSAAIEELTLQAMEEIYNLQYTAAIWLGVPDWALSKESFKVGIVDCPNFLVSRKLPRKPGKGPVDTLLTQEEYDKCFSEAIKLGRIKQDYEKGWKEYHAKVKNVLDSVNTTKQLLEIWPSLEPLIPPYILDADRSINLPALRIEELASKLKGGAS